MHSAVFNALANPVRREVVAMLLSEGRKAGAIAGAFDLSRPAVSEHLAVLKAAGIVVERRQGRERIYELNAGPLVELRAWLQPYEIYWRTRLAALARDVEESEA